jgi:hypothetical protein
VLNLWRLMRAEVKLNNYSWSCSWWSTEAKDTTDTKQDIEPMVCNRSWTRKTPMHRIH